MPSSIPYDPGLTLGQLIDRTKIDDLKRKAQLLKTKDDAENELNQAIQARNSLGFLKQELISLGLADDKDKLKTVQDKIDGFNSTVMEKAMAFVDTSIDVAESMSGGADSDKKTTGSTDSQTQINEEPESPVNFASSELLQMDLSSDTMNMNVEYMRNESNDDKSNAHATSVAAAVYATQSGFFTPTQTSKAAASVKATVYSQTSSHATEGTIIVTVNCTHKRTDLFSPLVLDADKCVEAWNSVNSSDLIDMADVKEMYELSTGKVDMTGALSILSGQTSGSSFIGLVHIVQKEGSKSSQSSAGVSGSVSTEIENNLFLSGKSGKFGLDASYSNNLKAMLSTSELESYCNVITMGCIPTIVSNTVETTVARLAPDPKAVMDQLSHIQGANDASVNNSMKNVQQAKDGESFMQLNNSYVTSVVSELGSYDNKMNKVINMNSLMTALDDFVKEAKDGKGGVPISFFVKTISKKMIGTEVMKKYFPSGYNGKEGEEGEED